MPLGAIIAAKAGFEVQELVQIKPTREDEAHVEAFEMWVAVRRPGSLSPASSKSATSLGLEQ